jgi:hypothetical protein
MYSCHQMACFVKSSKIKTLQHNLGYFNISLPIRNYCAHISGSVVTKCMQSMQLQSISNFRNHCLCKVNAILVPFMVSTVIIIIIIILSCTEFYFSITTSPVSSWALSLSLSLPLSFYRREFRSDQNSSVSIVTAVRDRQP